MTEKQAWLTIAEAYATPKIERSDKQWDLTRDGICRSIHILFISRGLIRPAINAMYRKVDSDVEVLSLYRMYFCTPIPANDALRADYCYLQYYILGDTR